MYDFKDTSDVSDYAIEAARHLVGCDAVLSSAWAPDVIRRDAAGANEGVGDRALIVIARLLQKHEPERCEDPDLAIVRELAAQAWADVGLGGYAKAARDKALPPENNPPLRVALAVYKAGKEAGRA